MHLLRPTLMSCESAIIFFIITYAYGAPTVRSDGFQQYIYEFSTVGILHTVFTSLTYMAKTMVLCVVIVANLFNGLHTSAWTGWSFFLIFIGIVLVWVFTVIDIHLPVLVIRLNTNRPSSTPSHRDGS